jgi:hypothetical protein
MEMNRVNNPNYFKLWDLKTTRPWGSPEKNLKHWGGYEIYAKTNKDLKMTSWNGIHPVCDNTTEHICKAGTRVRVWMVSRFGDVGVTDNLKNPIGYDIRGLDADEDLYDYEFIEI